MPAKKPHGRSWEPHQHAVLEAIRELGLELHVILNKGAVLMLPSGVNKATGLRKPQSGIRSLPATLPLALSYGLPRHSPLARSLRFLRSLLPQRFPNRRLNCPQLILLLQAPRSFAHLPIMPRLR